MNNQVTSAVAQVIVAVIPIVGIVIAGIILFFYLLWAHHEAKLKIRTGVYKKSEFDLKTFSLLAGILLVGIGFILTLSFAVIDGFSYALLGGLLPFIIGVCLLIFYKVNPDFKSK